MTPLVYDAVMTRDISLTQRQRRPRPQATIEGCIAAWLDPITSGACSGHLTLDHVKDEPMMGKRAPSDERHLVVLCAYHHLSGWATASRPKLRWYLRRYA